MQNKKLGIHPLGNGKLFIKKEATQWIEYLGKPTKNLIFEVEKALRKWNDNLQIIIWIKETKPGEN